MTMKDIPPDDWNEFQDPLPRFAIAEIYREQGWEPTIVSEQCERTSAWVVLIRRAMAKRLTAYDADLRVAIDEIGWIGLYLAGPNPPHVLGYWRTFDLSRCDIQRVVEAIEDTPDATLEAGYSGKRSQEQRDARKAWLKSIAAVATERVTFEALDSSRFYSIAVGEETRLFFIDAEDASLATFGATECSIAEDGVTLKGAGTGSTTELVEVTNGLTGRIVKLLRDPDGTKPVGAKLTTTVTLNPGDSFKLNANDLLADYTVSVEDVPDKETTDAS